LLCCFAHFADNQNDYAHPHPPDRSRRRPASSRRALGRHCSTAGTGLQTAAFLVAFNQHDPGLDAWLGLHAALAKRLPNWQAPAGPLRTVLLPAYHGVRGVPHLTPLLALLLKSFGVPVLIHGVLEGGGPPNQYNVSG
jgi:anthranilate phosphoribosyltransferase